jgi:hypothetical protein
MTFSFENKVVARYCDGRMVKGITYDFGPLKKMFHIVSDTAGVKTTHEISSPDLKALFFVKTLDGNKDAMAPHTISNEALHATGMMKLKITFFDGEVLLGTSAGYTPGREGFFIVPLEESSNNIRVYIIGSSTKQVERIN